MQISVLRTLIRKTFSGQQLKQRVFLGLYQFNQVILKPFSKLLFIYDMSLALFKDRNDNNHKGVAVLPVWTSLQEITP